MIRFRQCSKPGAAKVWSAKWGFFRIIVIFLGYSVRTGKITNLTMKRLNGHEEAFMYRTILHFELGMLFILVFKFQIIFVSWPQDWIV